MKKCNACLAIWILLCLCLSACSDEPRVYNDPFRQARDGVPFAVGDTVAEFRAINEDEHWVTTMDMAPFSFKHFYTPTTYYFLIHVIDMREIVFTKNWVDDAGNTREYEIIKTIFNVEVEKIFYNDPISSLKEGDTIQVFSSYRTSKDNI